MRDKLSSRVDGIRTAQLAYDAARDAFIAVPDPVPRPVSSLDEWPVDWDPDTPFSTLGWEPGLNVRGTYWVELTDGGTDFLVHGMIDADGDGVPAHYTATKSEGAQRLTPDEVY